MRYLARPRGPNLVSLLERASPGAVALTSGRTVHNKEDFILSRRNYTVGLSALAPEHQSRTQVGL
jgi:hypothetical protein